MRNTKVATCCYCGTRAALVLSGTDRHELACSSCGAPLHDLKMLPKREKATPSSDYPKSYGHGEYGAPKRAKKPKKRKKKKSFGRHLLGEVFDVIEDILD